MAAFPRFVAVDCPICRTPVDLPLSAGKHRPDDKGLVIDLHVDPSPLTAHVKAEHASRTTGSAPASQSEVTVHAQYRRPSDEGAYTRGISRGVAEQAAHGGPMWRR